ncbi:MAG: acetylserotonin O-methyltransferase [Acidobacteria bacterium]|nr:acetylserotonin O-methyltransferase [Acidobacteriota bacterium]
MSSRTTETLVIPAVKAAPSPDEILIPLFTGMWAMQAVATAARLGIADLLAAGPRTPEDIAAEAGTHPRATSRLLRALGNLRLASPVAGGRYELTAAGERLRTGVPGTFKDAFIAETDEVHWQSWARAADAVRTGDPRPQAVFGMPAFDYYAKHRDEGEQFGRAMENISRFAAHAVLEAYDFSGARTIIDVGGGNGSMAIAILEKNREAQGIVFDLPYIEGHAKERIRDLGVEGRPDTVSNGSCRRRARSPSSKPARRELFAPSSPRARGEGWGEGKFRSAVTPPQRGAVCPSCFCRWMSRDMRFCWRSTRARSRGVSDPPLSCLMSPTPAFRRDSRVSRRAFRGP